MPENATRPAPLTLVHADKDQLKLTAAARVLLEIQRALAAEPVVHLSLTGGSMGIAVWEGIAASPLARGLDWSRVHFWWSDERFLPDEDAERNAQQAFDAFLEVSEVPEENIHVMGSSDDAETPEAAAAAYDAVLRRFAPEGEEYPFFTLSLLGMGPDGHIASLFPGHEEIHDERCTVLGIEDSPKPPPQRTTLTLPLINRSARVWFLVAGQDKAEAFGRLSTAASSTASEETLSQTPAAGARGTQETLYLVTEDVLTD